MITKKQVHTIGIFDSGIGGYNILKTLLPRSVEKIIYLQDRKNLPYGDKTPEFIAQATLECVTFLDAQGVDAIIIACHTASSYAVDLVKQRFPHLPIIAMIDLVTKPAAAQTNNNKIGILATAATIKSHRHQQHLLAINPNLEIIEQGCPDLVPAIESSQNTEKVNLLVERYCVQMKAHDVDTIILGCTHYSFIKQQIRSYMANDVTLICAEDALMDLIAQKFELINNGKNAELITYEHTMNGYEQKPLIIQKHLLEIE